MLLTMIFRDWVEYRTLRSQQDHVYNAQLRHNKLAKRRYTDNRSLLYTRFLTALILIILLHIYCTEVRNTLEFITAPPKLHQSTSGANLVIPCALKAPINISDDDVYWSGPSGKVRVVNSAKITTHSSADTTCKAHNEVFVVRESKFINSEQGTLRHHSLNLYVCSATKRNSGIYNCGVWKNGNRSNNPIKDTLLTVKEGMCLHNIPLT